MQSCSGEANKLRYINTIRGTPRGIAIKEREINHNAVYTFIETLSLLIDKFKSKNAASLSELFVLFS